MTILECKTCGHIEFDEAPEMCLVCRSPKTAFAENAEAIKQPADPAALTDGDKKHIPVITVSKECAVAHDGACTTVQVKVGEINHVMQPAHYIRYVDVYLDKAFISRVWFSPEKTHPAASLCLSADAGSVIALENCNVHGNWMAEASL
jgi:superoxide reductase